MEAPLARQSPSDLIWPFYINNPGLYIKDLQLAANINIELAKRRMLLFICDNLSKAKPLTHDIMHDNQHFLPLNSC